MLQDRYPFEGRDNMTTDADAHAEESLDPEDGESVREGIRTGNGLA